MNCYLDVETLPTENPDDLAALRENATAPANLVDPVKIAAAKEASFTKAWEKTGLDGTYGTLAVIAFAVADGPVIAYSAEDQTERELLDGFWRRLDLELQDDHGNRREAWFVGFNLPFDLRFIWRRSVVHGIKPSRKWPYNAAPWNNKYTDLMYEWCGAKEYIKQKELCRILGIDIAADDIDGPDVYSTWKAGGQATVIEHCMRDVERVRELNKRLWL